MKKRVKYKLVSNKLYCMQCGKLLIDLKFQLQTDPIKHIYHCPNCKKGFKVSEEDHKKNKNL